MKKKTKIISSAIKIKAIKTYIFLRYLFTCSLCIAFCGGKGNCFFSAQKRKRLFWRGKNNVAMISIVRWKREKAYFSG
jgi:hypothetical protein